MNLLNLCDPEYLAQAQMVMNFIGDISIKPLLDLSMKHSIFFILLIIAAVPYALLGMFAVAWILHPLAAVALLFYGFSLSDRRKKIEALKASGQWTAQDETNERIDEMDWNNIIMNKQILEQLQIIAQNSKKR